MDSLATLKKHLKEKTAAPLYVFYGEETYLRDYYLKELQALTVPAGTEAFNLSRFDGGKSIQPESFCEAMDAAPFMSEKRMVLLWDVDIFKSDAAFRDIFLKYLDTGWDCVTLVVVYDSIPYKPDARTKLYKAVAGAALLVKFSQRSASDLLPWVKRRFAAFEKQIDTDNAQYLLFLCGSLMSTLIQEIEKIAFYSSTGEITRRHIDAVGTPTIEAAVFDMTDAIVAGKFGQAMALLRRLLDLREDPVMLLGALGNQLRGLYMARLAIEQGQGSQVVMKGMGYRSMYPADKLMNAAKRLRLPWCRRAVLKCAEADSNIKLGRDKQAVLEQLLLELAAG